VRARPYQFQRVPSLPRSRPTATSPAVIRPGRWGLSRPHCRWFHREPDQTPTTANWIIQAAVPRHACRAVLSRVSLRRAVVHTLMWRMCWTWTDTARRGLERASGPPTVFPPTKRYWQPPPSGVRLRAHNAVEFTLLSSFLR